MRILMINKFLYPNGGSETYIFKLGDYLKAQGHEVQYFGNIGVGAKIIGKITLADNIKIGANAVVNKSFFEQGITLVGVPAHKVEKK